MPYNHAMPRPDSPSDPSPLRAVFLGSGSSGNATAVSDGRTTLLLDCGFSARECVRRLRDAGVDPESVAAVLVTHEHADHVRGAEVFVRRYSVPVYATRGTLRASGLERSLPDTRVVRGHEELRIGTMRVLPFRISHDAREPVGFRFESDAGARVGIATDTGEFTPESAEALMCCETLGIECNHDPALLENGPYPYFLKQRIGSSRGHLSNPDAAAAVLRVAGPQLRAVFALHVSRTNNTATLATEAVHQRLSEEGLPVRVHAVPHDAPCDSTSVSPAG